MLRSLKPAFHICRALTDDGNTRSYGDPMSMAAMHFDFTFHFLYLLFSTFSHLQSSARWWQHTETQWAWQPWVRRGKNDVHRKFACSSFSNYLLLILFVSYISIFLSSLFALQFGLDILFSRWPALTLRDLMGKVNLFVECVDQLKFWFLFQTSRKSYF